MTGNAVVGISLSVAALLLFIHWKQHRTERPLPVHRTTRMKSGLLVAGGFVCYLVLLGVLAASAPVVGMLMYGALFLSSPSSWGWAVVAGSTAPWPVAQQHLPLFFAIPFPIIGFIVGYAAPLPLDGRKAIGAVGMRFALSFLGLCAFGPVLHAIAPS